MCRLGSPERDVSREFLCRGRHRRCRLAGCRPLPPPPVETRPARFTTPASGQCGKRRAVLSISNINVVVVEVNGAASHPPSPPCHSVSREGGGRWINSTPSPGGGKWGKGAMKTSHKPPPCATHSPTYERVGARECML